MASEERSDQLRRLLAMVDSTLIDLRSLSPLSQDEPLVKLRPNAGFEKPIVSGTSVENVPIVEDVPSSADLPFQWNHFQDDSSNTRTPVPFSESTDDLISFDWSPCLPTKPSTLSEAPERCLICDDAEWIIDNVDAKRSSTANKGVSTDHHPPDTFLKKTVSFQLDKASGNQETLEEIDKVVHAILASLSSDKASQTRKSPRRKDSDTSNRGPNHSNRTASSVKQTRSKAKAPAPNPSKSPRPLSLVKPAAPSTPTTSSTFRESSISTRTRASRPSALSARERRTVRETGKDMNSLIESCASHRGTSPFSQKRVHEAKRGAKSSLVTEPLTTVIRQIAHTTCAQEDDEDIMLIVARKAVPDCDMSSAVCIRLSRKARRKLSSMLSTLLVEHHPVDVGTMTDDQPLAKVLPFSARTSSLNLARYRLLLLQQVKSVRDLGTGGGDCVVVSHPSPSATSKEATPSKPVTDRTTDERFAGMAASLQRVRRWHRRHYRHQRTRCALTRNMLLSLYLSLLPNAFRSVSFKIVTKPSE